MTVPSGLAGKVVRWQASHGRSGLPWQGTRDPYRVWLSEVMLQQTQVSTVLAYFDRFVERFPDVASLAAASQDEVFALWSGLGYYSRARNLHRCAQEVVRAHAGRFPQTAAALQELPGIGRSTAAAIAAFCFGERAAILDGNVKRVVARVLGYGEDLALQANERTLWAKAHELLPRRDLQATMPRYTQGLMDLGATVCLARKPSCLLCPLQSDCAAHREGEPQRYPVKTRKLRRSAQSLWLLRARAADGSIWLDKRPGTGIWAGLHCLPVFESAEAMEEALPASARGRARPGEPFLHVLTHKDLHLHPIDVDLGKAAWRREGGAWFGTDQWRRLGLPAPVRRLLEGEADA